MVSTYNQYLMFSMAIGAANVLTKLAHPAVSLYIIMPFARMSSNLMLAQWAVLSVHHTY